jgi:DNA-binding transcriptional MerR regulator
MLIGELVKQSGLPKDTIRFYEKQGLISVGRKERRENNYKEYSQEVLDRLHTIKRLKDFGFTLNEVSGMLDLIEVNEATCNNVAHKITEKVSLLDEKIKDLIRVRTLLLNGADKCAGFCDPDKAQDNCPIIVSEKNEPAKRLPAQ